MDITGLEGLLENGPDRFSCIQKIRTNHGLPRGYPSERLMAKEAGWGSPERSIRGSDGVPTVSERDGGDRADWSPRSGRRELNIGAPPVGSSRERCGAKGIPSLASQKK